MTNDHEESVILGIVCKWKNKDDVKIHTISTIIEYKYHGILDINNISINPINIIKYNMGVRINLDDIEILDKFFYKCDPISIEDNTNIHHSVKYDATFVMPYDV